MLFEAACRANFGRMVKAKPPAIVISALMLAGCAAAYAPPQGSDVTASTAIPKSKSEILAVARQVVVAQGYQITAFDDRAGIVSTAPRNLKIGAEEADCGSTMGINYLWDNRTTTRVGFGVIAEDGKLQVRANIEGEYRPGSTVQDLTLSCRSKGVLDRDMLQRIQLALGASGATVALTDQAPVATPASVIGVPAPVPASYPAGPVYSTERIDQLVAAIALYPDDLLALILTASTYPEEWSEAARWIETPDYMLIRSDRDRLRQRLAEKDWDPSVRSLVFFPMLLAMMDSDRDWSDALGDAVLAQLPDVMNEVQRLRELAWNAGWMKATEFQRFEKQESRIVILPSTAGIIFIPYYDPRISFGRWLYPGSPPVVLVTRGRPPGGERNYVALDVTPVTSIVSLAELDWPSQGIAVDTHWYDDTDDYTPTRARRNGYVWFHDSTHRRTAAYRVAPARDRVLPVSTAGNNRSREASRPQAAQVAAPAATAGRPNPSLPQPAAARTESPATEARERFTRERERTQPVPVPGAASSEPQRGRPSQATEQGRGAGPRPGLGQGESSFSRRPERSVQENASGTAIPDPNPLERRQRSEREGERGPTPRPTSPATSQATSPTTPTLSQPSTVQPASAGLERRETDQREPSRGSDPRPSSPAPAAAPHPEAAKAAAPPPAKAGSPPAPSTTPADKKKKDPNDKSS